MYAGHISWATWNFITRLITQCLSSSHAKRQRSSARETYTLKVGVELRLRAIWRCSTTKSPYPSHFGAIHSSNVSRSQLEIANNLLKPHFVVQGRSRSSMLVPPESSSAVLVMVSSKSVSIRKRSRGRRVLLFDGLSSPSGRKFGHKKN